MDAHPELDPVLKLGFYEHPHEVHTEHDIHLLLNTTGRNTYRRVPTQHVPAKEPCSAHKLGKGSHGSQHCGQH